MTPPTTMIAAVVGAAVMGFSGALVATPLVGAAKAIYLEATGTAKPEPDAGAGVVGRVRRLVNRGKD